MIVPPSPKAKPQTGFSTPKPDKGKGKEIDGDELKPDEGKLVFIPT